MVLLFSSDNLLTTHEQLSVINSIEIYYIVLFYKQKVDLCCIKCSMKTYQLVFYKQKIDSY